VSYFILLAVGKFLNMQLGRLNLILASLLGGVYSLTVILPKLPAVLSIMIKLVMSAAMLGVAFGFHSPKFFLKAITTFYMINFIFLGVMFLIWNFVSPPGLFMKNDVVYLDISPILLTIATFVSYVAFVAMNKILARQVPGKIFLKVAVGVAGKEAIVRAKIDTGNTLREPFSSLPVMVVEYKHVKEIIPKEIRKFMDNISIPSAKSSPVRNKEKLNCRIIPFRSISGDGILPAFKPDKFYLVNSKKPILKEVYVAICKEGMLPCEFGALVSEEIIS
jgi:stage II sporulation protein GA (sporulation sigma-E factor processing peptidase)